MKNLKKFSLVAVLLLSGGSSAVFAQSVANDASWYIEPSLNLIQPDSGFGLTDQGEGGGLRAGKALSDNWDVQVGTSYAHSNGSGVHYQQNLLGADALYVFSRQAVRPFVLVGVGYQEDRQNSSTGQTSGYAPYVEAGLGAEFALNNKWSIEADLRRVHGYLRDNDFASDRSSNNYFNLGFTYTFDNPGTHASSRQ